MGALKTKPQYYKSLNIKLLLFCLFLVSLLFLVLKSNFSFTSQQHSSSPATAGETPTTASSFSSSGTTQTVSISSSPPESPCTQLPNPSPESPCAKLPSPVMQALLHYAASNITPQQTIREISVTADVLQKRGPCNFLVFGLGHDSLLWSTLNYKGRTVFLEEDKVWIDRLTKQLPGLEVYHVVYDTKVSEADELLNLNGVKKECVSVSDPRFSECRLALKGLPDVVYEVEWDSIMVDAPTGYHDEAPGRMGAIYTAGLMARNRREGSKTDVFVHDCDRKVEDKYSMAFLCEGYMMEEEGRLRHFNIPSQNGSGVVSALRIRKQNTLAPIFPNSLFPVNISLSLSKTHLTKRVLMNWFFSYDVDGWTITSKFINK